MQKDDILQGKYLIDGEIGRGGMGVLYLVHHKMMPGLYAIKSLLPDYMHNSELRQRFLAEINTHSKMRHPNIVRVTDCFEENDQLFIVMDYIEGSSLDRKLKEAGRIPEKQALGLMRPVLEAMQYAHERNIVHRDIKPNNILLGTDNIPRVTDFGIAIDNTASRLTGTPGTAIGTVHYMSPEQIQTPMEIDSRSDIYSLGVLLFEMLSGDVPFGGTELAICKSHIDQPPPDLTQRFPDISKAAMRIIRTAMAKKPEERFQTCGAFIEAIDAIIRPRTKQSVWPYYVLAFVLVLAPVIYWLAPPRTLWVTDPKQQHETAFAMIQGANEQNSIVCIKEAELPLKQTNLDLAQKNGFYDLIDGYKNQIQDINATLQDSTLKFNNFIAELNKIPADIVKEEFGHYRNVLRQTGRNEQINRLEHLRQLYNSNTVKVDEFC